LELVFCIEEKGMKHEASLNQIFEMLYEPWMSQEDKDYVKSELLKSMGVTMEQLDEDLETGVKNGFSVEVQLELIRKFIAKKRKQKQDGV
jgi:hypothetical protein